MEVVDRECSGHAICAAADPLAGPSVVFYSTAKVLKAILELLLRGTIHKVGRNMVEGFWFECADRKLSPFEQ